MSIRIRRIDGLTIAICAARSIFKPGDIYLDDAAHYALYVKFASDFASEGVSEQPSPELAVMEQEESDNENRSAWDLLFGSGGGDCPNHIQTSASQAEYAPDILRPQPLSDGAASSKLAATEQEEGANG